MLARKPGDTRADAERLLEWLEEQFNEDLRHMYQRAIAKRNVLKKSGHDVPSGDQ